MTDSAKQLLKRDLITRLTIDCSTWGEICQLADGHTVNKTECFFSGIGVVVPQDIKNECHRLLNRDGLPHAPAWARYVALDEQLYAWHWFDEKPYYSKEKEAWFPLTAKSRVSFAGTAIGIPAGYDCEKSLYKINQPAKLKKSFSSRIKSMFKIKLV